MEDIDKIPFYKERSIGERMTAAIDFLRQNWPVMFRTAIYMLLPLSIVQSVAMNSFFGDYMGFAINIDSVSGGMDGEMGIVLRLLSSYGILMACLFLGYILLQTFSFTMVQEYNEREEGLEGVTLNTVWPRMWHNMKRVMKSTCAMAGAIIVLLALSLLNPLALILFIPALIAFSVPMMMFPCIYVFENVNLKQATQKSLRLGFSTWAGLFVINVIISFVMNIVSQAVSIPWGVCVGLSAIFVELGEAPQWLEITVHVLSFLFGVIMMFVTYLTMTMQPLATAYHYAHATERKDSITVDADIENFENLE